MNITLFSPKKTYCSVSYVSMFSFPSRLANDCCRGVQPKAPPSWRNRLPRCPPMTSPHTLFAFILVPFYLVRKSCDKALSREVNRYNTLCRHRPSFRTKNPEMVGLARLDLSL